MKTIDATRKAESKVLDEAWKTLAQGVTQRPVTRGGDGWTEITVPIFGRDNDFIKFYMYNDWKDRMIISDGGALKSYAAMSGTDPDRWQAWIQKTAMGLGFNLEGDNVMGIFPTEQAPQAVLDMIHLIRVGQELADPGAPWNEPARAAPWILGQDMDKDASGRLWSSRPPEGPGLPWGGTHNGVHGRLGTKRKKLAVYEV